MGDAQHKGGVVEGLLSEQGQRLRLYFQDLLAVKFGDGDVLFAEQIVFRIVVRQRKRILINKRFSRHSHLLHKDKNRWVVPAVMNQNIMDIHG